jgi:ribosomal protein S18 acetylase RimI-like enzyme
MVMTMHDALEPSLTADETRSLFRNCRSYWHAYGHAQRVDDGMTLYSVGVRHPQLNGVMWVEGGDLPLKVRDARTRLAKVPWLWWIGPDSDPAILEFLLKEGGTRVGAVPVMAIRTGAVQKLPYPKELEITLLEPAEDLTEWVKAYAPAMGVAPSDIPAMTAAEHARTDEPGTLVRFAGRIDGRIVGVSELLLAHGVAGIYLVATAEDQRRRGIGAALTSVAITLGRECGAALATLQASPAGQHLYRRMGFAKVADYQIVRMPPLG